MVKLARRHIRGYDIHERTDTPRSLSVPNQDAARRIIEDVAREDMLLNFVEQLVEMQEKGFVGRRYRIVRLQEIIEDLRNDGYLFDVSTGKFYENVQKRKSYDWGVLKDGSSYALGFLSIDVKDNSELVRRYGPEMMDGVYGSLRKILERALDKRNGRLWYWEGDGGLAAFHTDVVAKSAVETGMEVLHEILLYNALWNPLDDPIEVRMAANTGSIVFSSQMAKLRNETVIAQTLKLESDHAAPNGLAVATAVVALLDSLLQRCFADYDGDPTVQSYKPHFVDVGAAG